MADMRQRIREVTETFAPRRYSDSELFSTDEQEFWKPKPAYFVNMPAAWPCSCQNQSCYNARCPAKGAGRKVTFPQFAKFPPEIQERIFEMALDNLERRRVIPVSVQLKAKVSAHVCEQDGGRFCGNADGCYHADPAAGMPQAAQVFGEDIEMVDADMAEAADVDVDVAMEDDGIPKAACITEAAFFVSHGAPAPHFPRRRGIYSALCDYNALNATCRMSRYLVSQRFPQKIQLFARPTGQQRSSVLLTRTLLCNPETDILLIDGLPYEGFTNAGEVSMFLPDNLNEIRNFPAGPQVLSSFVRSLGMFKNVALSTVITRGEDQLGDISDSGYLPLVLFFMKNLEHVYMFSPDCLHDDGYRGRLLANPSDFNGECSTKHMAMRWQIRTLMRKFREWQVLTRPPSDDTSTCWVPRPRALTLPNVGILEKPISKFARWIAGPPPSGNTSMWVMDPSPALEESEANCAEMMANTGMDKFQRLEED